MNIDEITEPTPDGFPPQLQTQPGLTDLTVPRPDHGEEKYVGSGRLKGKVAFISGGDSGIGRAVAIAYAREGADVAISYLPEEHDDAHEVAQLIQAQGVRSLLLPGDITNDAVAKDVVQQTVSQLGGLNILVLNAGYQQNRDGIEKITVSELDRTFVTNLYAPIWMIQAALEYLPIGASIIVTSSIQAFQPSPNLLDYAMTKSAQVTLVKALAQELGPRGIRVNAVAPGPVWTPFIAATDWPEKLPTFGQDTPLGRAGQPAELASTYVYLAEDASSFVSGSVCAVTGGKGL